VLLHFRQLLLAFAITAAAVGNGRAETGDQDALWSAVKRGEIRPLADLIGIVRNRLPGEITGVEIEREHGRWVYEFRVVDTKGRLLDVHVDARSGNISRIKEK
jgi:uncharacterized membrane protein YkoI